MTDFDALILELLLQLTQDQQQTALDFLRLLTEGADVDCPCVKEGT